MDMASMEEDFDNPQPSSSRGAFHVNQSLIQAIPENEQASELQGLDLKVYDQNEFEEGVMDQVDQALEKEEQNRLTNILNKELKGIREDMRLAEQELQNLEKVLNMVSSSQDREAQRKLTSVKAQKENKVKHLKRLKSREKTTTDKLAAISRGEDCHHDDGTGKGMSMLQQALLGGKRKETEQERMIRMGEMTPFGSINTGQPQNAEMTDFEKYLADQSNKAAASSKKTGRIKKVSSDTSMMKNKGSKGSLTKSSSEVFNGAKKNFFDSKDKKTYSWTNEKDFSDDRYHMRKVKHPKLKHNFSYDRMGRLSDTEYGDDDNDELVYEPDERLTRENMLNDDDIHGKGLASARMNNLSKKGKGKRPRDVDYVPPSDEDDNDLGAIKSSFGVKRKKQASYERTAVGKCRDDGHPAYYEARLRQHRKAELLKKQQKIISGEESDEESDDENKFEGGFVVPRSCWDKLFRYQKTGVRWLWELHCQQAGGIVGDEMGLGKTIQTISFLAGLRASGLKDRGATAIFEGLGPSIIVCPTTVMHQWVKEFHKWAPQFRVAVLHNTGSFTSSAAQLIRDIALGNGIIITAYSTITLQQDLLLQYDWHYIILDEGHKIRNPDAQVTIACKQFRTCHRVILSGSPIQNNLKELWSLFDFVFPGKLGTLPDFMAHFSVPIVQGGYSNASQLQVQTAYKCACVLRDTINPYMLRRMKADVKVNLSLPDKNEQVLFCRLSKEQRDVYQEYLDSKECNMILSGNYMVFPGLITLRKVCNHPDISTGGPKSFHTSFGYSAEEMEYGYYKRSGKMMVVDSLLKLWKKQDHRVLVFTQSAKMLDILESFVRECEYSYMRMDGGTTIGARQPLISKFNNDPSIFVFLLTTRVGGLGVNLTGADRVIIYDPDWNPSTDTQARERAWRIGQKKQVTIYRLLTTGTIEEKIYHRQIFKQFLTNRVLKDPKQRRFFKANDLYELFTLTDDQDKGTETSAIFAGTGSDVTVKPKIKRESNSTNSSQRNRFDVMREKKAKEKLKQEKEDGELSDEHLAESGEEGAELTGEEIKEEKRKKRRKEKQMDKIAQMRELARKLSQQISANKTKSEIDVDPSLRSEGVTSSPSSDHTPDPRTPITENPDDKETPQLLAIEKQSSHEDEQGLHLSGSSDSKVGQDKIKIKREKSRDESRRDKKKKRKDALIDGEKIAFLDKRRRFKQRDSDEANSSKHDEYVLKKLFNKSGIHSAIQHDKIMMSSDPDYAIVEGEAERVAKEAARALKASRQRCHRATSGIPTWTGQNGGIGKIESKPRFGRKKNNLLVDASEKSKPSASSTLTKQKSQEEKPSEKKNNHFDGSVVVPSSSMTAENGQLASNNLLNKMRQRNYLLLEARRSPERESLNDDDPPPAPEPVTMDTNSKEYELLEDIRCFVAFGGMTCGMASTTEILDKFRDKLPPGDSATFKAMLNEICDFHRRDGQGKWSLKTTFR